MYLEQVFGVIKIGVFVLLLVSITFSIIYVLGRKMHIRWVSNMPTKKICLYSILMTYFLMLFYVVFWRGSDSGGEYTFNLKYLILCDMPGIQETGWSGEILF